MPKEKFSDAFSMYKKERMKNLSCKKFRSIDFLWSFLKLGKILVANEISQ